MIYISAENGIGFQYLWSQFPEINPYVDSIGIFIGISAMLFFTISFIDLKAKAKKLRNLLLLAFLIRLFIAVIKIFYKDFQCEFVDLFYIQIALTFGTIQYRTFPKEAKWYVIAYFSLDMSFLISAFEHWDLLPSNPFTVYSVNIGIILQFLFLSIAIAEAIKQTYRIKNEAQANLILQYKHNEELKENINRELEQKVMERTRTLEIQNNEIQIQREEIRTINENLESLVRKRTFQLEERNMKISEYSFSNSHLVRWPLAQILGLSYLAKVGEIGSTETILLIEENARELDEVIKKMTRILEENESFLKNN